MQFCNPSGKALHWKWRMLLVNWVCGMISSSAPVDPGPHDQSSFINTVSGAVRGITQGALKQDSQRIDFPANTHFFCFPKDWCVFTLTFLYQIHFYSTAGHLLKHAIDFWNKQSVFLISRQPLVFSHKINLHELEMYLFIKLTYGCGFLVV